MSTSGGEGWIAVDLDGTLATYDHWRGIDHIGAPIPLMVSRVRAWLAEGREVRIFTARACPANISQWGELRVMWPIREWCKEHLGQQLLITATKDFTMAELWDDRCTQVVTNTGQLVVGAIDEARREGERVRGG